MRSRFPSPCSSVTILSTSIRSRRSLVHSLSLLNLARRNPSMDPSHPRPRPQPSNPNPNPLPGAMANRPPPRGPPPFAASRPGPPSINNNGRRFPASGGPQQCAMGPPVGPPPPARAPTGPPMARTFQGMPPPSARPMDAPPPPMSQPYAGPPHQFAARRPPPFSVPPQTVAGALPFGSPMWASQPLRAVSIDAVRLTSMAII